MKSDRIRFIDVGRGTAMLFVCLAHFTEAYLRTCGKPGLIASLLSVSMLASPTFMLISGMMLGYLHNTKTNSFQRIKLKLIDRGLFLITIAHVIIFFTFVPFMREHYITLKVTFVTDAFGISMILGVLLAERVSKYYRLLIGILLYTGSSYIASLDRAANPVIGNMLEVLFGSYSHKTFFDTFPFIPLLIIFP
jgi:uncharacterized membrane protein